MRSGRILIVEDDDDIRGANRAALELEGYVVVEADSLSDAQSHLKNSSPDLIILDILLPDGNGLRYCEELRGTSGVRILFLSALNTKADLIAGLRAGGDDYITKPYDMEELLLRVEALLRRGKLVGAGESLQGEPLKSELEQGEPKQHNLLINEPLKNEPFQVAGNLTLNHISRRAYIRGVDLMLKPKEFSLLSILMEQKEQKEQEGEFISAAELYQKVWGMDTAGDARTVKEHISRLRSKLGRDSGITIISERGKGYRLVVE